MSAPNPIVAVCQGHRCQALLSRQEPDGMAAIEGLARESRLGVVMSTPCAGACSHGPVVALGAAQELFGRKRVMLRDLLGPVESGHVADLGTYLSMVGAGPLPERLEQIRVPPA